MKYKWILFLSVCFIFLILFGYARQDDFPLLKGSYLGQKPPGMTPEVFAPGIISFPDHRELAGGTFSSEGNRIAFASDRNGNRDIWVMDIDMQVIKRTLRIKSIM